VVNLAGADGTGPVSFTVERGRLTVLTGGVGRGKTRLLLRILGLSDDTPPPGVLWWNDSPIDDPHTILRPPRAAAVPEQPRFVGGTVRDNILVGRTASAADMARAVALAALDADLTSFPDGLDTPVGAGGHRLSGGQRVRLAVARAVLSRPQLLVADSLSAALDGDTEAELWSGLLGEGMAILAVSNRSAVLVRATTVVDLGGG
jgi:ABC-type transport system involved in cytochrome bd biosynthesis fused ATPase/permease subunit